MFERSIFYLLQDDISKYIDQILGMDFTSEILGINMKINHITSLSHHSSEQDS